MSVLAIGAAVIVVAVAAGPAVGSAVGSCSPGTGWPAARADLAQQVVALVNSHRQQLGLSTLNVSPTLTKSAAWKAAHMAEYQYMQHDDPAPPVARTVAQRLDACGYPGDTSGWGENIAYGFQTAQDVMNAWLNSPGHKANIENASYRAIGVGAATATNGSVYWTQDFGTADDSGASGGGSGGGSAAPTVKLTATPPQSGAPQSASFAWSTTGTVSSTSCSLDGAAASACSSPKAYGGLAAGAHTFRVTVSGPGGSAAGTYTWSVAGTQTAPTVRITTASASSLSTTASFSWSTTGTVTSTTCSLDNAVAKTCASPASYGGLASGSHTFRVTVAGPSGSASAAYSWTVGGTGGCRFGKCP